jgi:NDP-sugar pyrophosphorylase family protein
MQALILAAGMGTRLAPLTTHTTKCMVPLHGRPLIAYMLDGLAQAGISRVVMVVGHGADAVQAALGDSHADLPIAYIENPDYRTTNNIYSLALAAPQLQEEDTLLIESDLIVAPSILRACAEEPGQAVALVAPYEAWMDGTVTLLGPDRSVRRFVSKQLLEPELARSYYKTVNIYKLGRSFARGCFVPELERCLASAGPQNYYETVFGRIVEQGLAPIRAVIVEGAPWYEIDTPEDLAVAERLFDRRRRSGSDQ